MELVLSSLRDGCPQLRRGGRVSLRGNRGVLLMRAVLLDGTNFSCTL